jgi:hypothetical protein
MRRLITKFRHGEDCRAGEIDISSLPLTILQDIFKPAEDDILMYNSYPLDTIQALAIQPYVAEPLSLNIFEYYVEVEG